MVWRLGKMRINLTGQNRILALSANDDSKLWQLGELVHGYMSIRLLQYVAMTEMMLQP